MRGRAVAALFLLSSCAPLTGTASLTRLALHAPAGAVPATSEVIEVEECWRWYAIFFATGAAAPSHEPLIQKVLAEHQADVLLDAELTTTVYGFPYIYMCACVGVRGRPAKLEEVRS